MTGNSQSDADAVSGVAVVTFTGSTTAEVDAPSPQAAIESAIKQAQRQSLHETNVKFDVDIDGLELPEDHQSGHSTEEEGLLECPAEDCESKSFDFTIRQRASGNVQVSEVGTFTEVMSQGEIVTDSVTEDGEVQCSSCGAYWDVGDLTVADSDE